MKTSSRGIKLIAGYEGFRPIPYLCAGGRITIGFGHLIMPYEKFTEITIAQAQKLLAKDCAIAERAVTRLVTKAINQDIFDALVSFTFNVGSGNFNRSSVLRFLNAGDYYHAAMSFRLWTKAGGRPLSGLIKRRAEEALVFTVGAVKLRKIR